MRGKALKEIGRVYLYTEYEPKTVYNKRPSFHTFFFEIFNSNCAYNFSSIILSSVAWNLKPVRLLLSADILNKKI